MSTAIVFTTINGGAIVENLAANLRRHGREKETAIYAIPDVTTPKEFFAVCKKTASEGIRIVFPSMEEQAAFLNTLPDCPPIPEKTDNRRNVGFLMALRDGAGIVLSLDDDNFFDEDIDAVGEHCARLDGGSAKLPVTESSDHFWNCCALLPFETPHPVYPRGYPLTPRHGVPSTKEQSGTGMPTWINAGMWLNAPDADAFQWLAAGKALASASWSPRDVRLGRGTWCPVNSQNTAVRRELMPAYYYLPMRSPDLEMPIDRYGDILSGYFALACAKAHGATVNFGVPAARHIRNVHDYASDFRREMLCLSIIDELLEWLIGLELKDGTVAETYEDLAMKLEAQASRFAGKTWTPGLRAHFRFMASCMRQWVKTLAHLGIA